MFTSTDLKFSRDWESTLADVCRPYDAILILTSSGGRARGLVRAATESLGEGRITVLPAAPSYPSVDKLVELYGDIELSNYDVIVAIGGGSVIDSAKSIVLAQSTKSVHDFTCKLRAGVDDQNSSGLHLIAIPTTAGTGSEVTSFATIWDLEAVRKSSISGQGLRPKVAIVDSSLLETLAGDYLLYPALDAVSHAIESLWSRRATPISALRAATGLGLMSSALRSCLTERPDLKRLSLGSVYSGLAIAESRTAIAHAISYPMTLRFQVPHGLACSFTLSAIHHRLIARLGPYSDYTPWIDEALEEISWLGLSRRVQQFVSLDESLAVVGEMFTAGRGDNCLLDFSQSDVVDILKEAFGQ